MTKALTRWLISHCGPEVRSHLVFVYSLTASATCGYDEGSAWKANGCRGWLWRQAKFGRWVTSVWIKWNLKFAWYRGEGHQNIQSPARAGKRWNVNKMSSYARSPNSLPHVARAKLIHCELEIPDISTTTHPALYLGTNAGSPILHTFLFSKKSCLKSKIPISYHANNRLYTSGMCCTVIRKIRDDILNDRTNK